MPAYSTVQVGWSFMSRIAWAWECKNHQHIAAQWRLKLPSVTHHLPIRMIRALTLLLLTTHLTNAEDERVKRVQTAVSEIAASPYKFDPELVPLEIRGEVLKSVRELGLVQREPT